MSVKQRLDAFTFKGEYEVNLVEKINGLAENYNLLLEKMLNADNDFEMQNNSVIALKSNLSTHNTVLNDSMKIISAKEETDLECPVCDVGHKKDDLLAIVKQKLIKGFSEEILKAEKKLKELSKEGNMQELLDKLRDQKLIPEEDK